MFFTERVNFQKLIAKLAEIFYLTERVFLNAKILVTVDQILSYEKNSKAIIKKAAKILRLPYTFPLSLLFS